MRFKVAFVLICLSCYAFCAETERPAAVASDGVDQTVSARSRRVLERWEASFTKEDLAWLKEYWPDCRAYVDVWATVDLDHAVKLEKKHRNRGTQLRLAQRMAGARRWDDLEAFADSNAKYFSNRYFAAPFWARVANYGAQLGDLKVVDLAGRRLEALATAQPSEAGKPPRPSTEIAMARFYVAAARLHVLREDQSDLMKQTNEERKATLVAADDLWRAAGAVVPQRSIFSAGANVSGIRGFTVLESWMPSSKNDFGFGHPPEMTFAGEIVKQLETEDRLVPRWPIGVTLPDIGQPVVSGWLERQVVLGRAKVALTAIWLAPGSDIDRAGQLAVVARHLPDDEAELATSLRTAADKALQASDEMNDSRVRALAELSLAFSAAGDFEDAQRCIDATAAAYSNPRKRKIDSGQIKVAWLPKEPEFYGYESGIDHTTNDVVLQAIAALPETHPLLERVFAFNANRRFSLDKLTSFELHVDGLVRRVDLTDVVPESLYREPVSYNEHSDYRRLFANKDWLSALREADRLAKGNPAWHTSFAQIGAESVRDIGLAKTLKWCEQLPNTKMRLPAEVGAIREALGNERQTLPVLNPTSARFVAPTISWPSGC